MSLLVAGIARHPVMFALAVVAALCLVAYGMDVFVGAAERDEPGDAPR